MTAVIDQDGHAPRALTYESNARVVVLGRDDSSDFQLPLPTVSRHHARISEADGVYTIEDLGSSHGTVLNGRPLAAGEKRVLRDSDILELTRAKVTCAIEADKVASAAPGEGTQAIAQRAVQGILGRLGDAKNEGPYLRVLSAGPDENKRYNLSAPQSEWTLGRSKDCECVLEDLNVSRRHILIKKDWNGYILQDLGSKNGVMVNERQVTKNRRLRDRDEITIGPVRLIFIDPDAGLMDALKNVPGFEFEESDVDEAPAGPAADGSVGAPMLSPGDVRPAAPIAPLEKTAQQEEEEALMSLDPSLLETGPGRSVADVAMLVGAGLLIAGCGVGLYLVLQ